MPASEPSSHLIQHSKSCKNCLYRTKYNHIIGNNIPLAQKRVIKSLPKMRTLTMNHNHKFSCHFIQLNISDHLHHLSFWLAKVESEMCAKYEEAHWMLCWVSLIRGKTFTQFKDIFCSAHEIHENCHSVTFYFMKNDSKRCCDTTTPESIHTKDESKRGSAFAFIFGVNWPVQWM